MIHKLIDRLLCRPPRLWGRRMKSKGPVEVYLRSGELRILMQLGREVSISMAEKPDKPYQT